MSLERWEIVDVKEVDGPFPTRAAAVTRMREHARILVQRGLTPEYGVRVATFHTTKGHRWRGGVTTQYVVELVRSRRVEG